MHGETWVPNKELRVDGGACMNSFLMQFQADMLGVPVSRPKMVESTARGASFLAGLATGFWRDQSEVQDTFTLDRRFEPSSDEAKRNKLFLTSSCCPRFPNASVASSMMIPYFAKDAWIRFFSLVRSRLSTMRVRGRSRRSQICADGIQTVGSVPVRWRRFNP